MNNPNTQRDHNRPQAVSAPKPGVGAPAAASGRAGRVGAARPSHFRGRAAQRHRRAGARLTPHPGPPAAGSSAHAVAADRSRPRGGREPRP
ncbi:hypothetical protein GCM10009834_24070 [Streptomonospora arabica]